MNPEIIKNYGHLVRIRVCGLCWGSGDSLLLINHKMHANSRFWAPPGGGIEFGESAQEALVREFKEETGLSVAIGKLSFTCEFISPPLHAIELFFPVTWIGGELQKGTDPEMDQNNQLIEEVRFLPFSQIMELPQQARHGIFNLAKSADQINGLSGYIKI